MIDPHALYSRDKKTNDCCHYDEGKFSVRENAQYLFYYTYVQSLEIPSFSFELYFYIFIFVILSVLNFRRLKLVFLIFASCFISRYDIYCHRFMSERDMRPGSAAFRPRQTRPFRST